MKNSKLKSLQTNLITSFQKMVEVPQSHQVSLLHFNKLYVHFSHLLKEYHGYVHNQHSLLHIFPTWLLINTFSFLCKEDLISVNSTLKTWHTLIQTHKTFFLTRLQKEKGRMFQFPPSKGQSFLRSDKYLLVPWNASFAVFDKDLGTTWLTWKSDTSKRYEFAGRIIEAWDETHFLVSDGLVLVLLNSNGEFIQKVPNVLGNKSPLDQYLLMQNKIIVLGFTSPRFLYIKDLFETETKTKTYLLPRHKCDESFQWFRTPLLRWRRKICLDRDNLFVCEISITGENQIFCFDLDVSFFEWKTGTLKRLLSMRDECFGLKGPRGFHFSVHGNLVVVSIVCEGFTRVLVSSFTNPTTYRSMNIDSLCRVVAWHGKVLLYNSHRAHVYAWDTLLESSRKICSENNGVFV